MLSAFVSILFAFCSSSFFHPRPTLPCSIEYRTYMAHFYMFPPPAAAACFCVGRCCCWCFGLVATIKRYYHYYYYFFFAVANRAIFSSSTDWLVARARVWLCVECKNRNRMLSILFCPKLPFCFHHRMRPEPSAMQKLPIEYERLSEPGTHNDKWTTKKM